MKDVKRGNLGRLETIRNSLEMERRQKQPQNYFGVTLKTMGVPLKTAHGWIERMLEKKQANKQETYIMFTSGAHFGKWLQQSTVTHFQARC